MPTFDGEHGPRPKAIVTMRKREHEKSTTSVTTGEVQEFYERYPYPPPVKSLENYREAWRDPAKRRADHHLFWPARPFREDRSVLIAGCGTSQAAKHALRWPEAQVVGIDFSETSVRCTEELKRKHRIGNLDVRQLPIERAGELGKQFDQVVCTGVLHHLANPDAGLRTLRDLLKPDGAMHLMVYAPYGRAGIYMLQEFCRRLDIRATDKGIRDLIEVLHALPSGHPLEGLLRQAPDFREEAALADALLHPRDRAYSVPQFFDFIGNAGLTFGRWLRQGAYSPHCGIIAKLPVAARLMELPAAEQYAAVELFRGTMIRHSAAVYRDDGPVKPQPIDFAGEAWSGYVPIRLSDTMCIQERLPAGAAAVLLNRSHVYRDIYLPIDAFEKSVFDAIDGKRNIEDIANELPAAMSETAKRSAVRRFFERLFLCDQVVFDTSPRPRESRTPAG